MVCGTVLTLIQSHLNGVNYVQPRISFFTNFVQLPSLTCKWTIIHADFHNEFSGLFLSHFLSPILLKMGWFGGKGGKLPQPIPMFNKTAHFHRKVRLLKSQTEPYNFLLKPHYLPNKTLLNGLSPRASTGERRITCTSRYLYYYSPQFRFSKLSAAIVR